MTTLVGAMAVVGLTLGPALSAAAAEPAPIGFDGDYVHDLDWKTPDSAMSDAGLVMYPFDGPSALRLSPDGTSLYGFDKTANLASNSPQVQKYDGATGALTDTLLPERDGRNGDTVGMWVAPTGAVWVLFRGFQPQQMILSEFTAAGDLVDSYPYPALGEREETRGYGLVGTPEGTFYSIEGNDEGEQSILGFTPLTGEVTHTPIALTGYIDQELFGGSLQFNDNGDLVMLAGDEGGAYGNSRVVSIALDGSLTGDLRLPVSGRDGFESPAQVNRGLDGKYYAISYDAQELFVMDAGLTTVTTVPIDVEPFTLADIRYGGAAIADQDGRLYISTYLVDGEVGPNDYRVVALEPLRAPVVTGLTSSTGLCSSVTGAVTATGSPAPSWYAVTAGQLPAGVDLNQNTGELSGTATEAGTFIATVTAYNGVTYEAPASSPDSTTVTLTVTASAQTAGTSVITGTPAVGSTLHAVTAGWNTAATMTYQWLRGGVPIADATTSNYEVIPADAGQEITVAVTASDPCLLDAQASSPGIRIAISTTPTTPGTDDPSASTKQSETREKNLATTGSDIAFSVTLAVAGLALLTIGSVLFLRRRQVRR